MSADAQLRRSMSLENMSFTEALGKAVNAVIRPPRASYDEDQISYIVFDMHLPPIPRIPLAFPNRRGERLVGSLYISGTFETEKKHRCIIYLHGNIGSQKEGRFIVPFYAPHGISIFCFDFSGSGNSGGQYVTLGKNEKTDVVDVIRFLQEAMQFDEFILWGRSMGAACAILAAALLTREINEKMRKIAQTKQKCQSSPAFIPIPPRRTGTFVMIPKPLAVNEKEGTNEQSKHELYASSQNPFENIAKQENKNPEDYHKPPDNNNHYTYQMAAIAGTFKKIEKEAAKAQKMAEYIDKQAIEQHQEIMKNKTENGNAQKNPNENAETQKNENDTQKNLIDMQKNENVETQKNENDIQKNENDIQKNENDIQKNENDAEKNKNDTQKNENSQMDNESTADLTHVQKRSPENHILPANDKRDSLSLHQQSPQKRIPIPMLDGIPTPSIRPAPNSSRISHLPPPIPPKFEEKKTQANQLQSTSAATITAGPTLGTPSASVSPSSSESSMSISVPSMCVKGIIVDSAYSSLDDMLSAISEKCKLGAISNFVAQWWIKKSIQELVGLSVDDVKPYESAQICFRTPMLLGHSPEDDFIPFSQAQKIYKAYAGPKQLVILNGSHNAPRDEHWIKECTHFISKCFDMPLEELNQTVSIQNPEHVASFFNLLKDTQS